MKKLKVAINGIGRIGKCVLRSYFEAEEHIRERISIVAINFGSGSLESRLHGIKYDSTHGLFEKSLRMISETQIIVDERYVIEVLFKKQISDIDWFALDVDTVLECTGKFNEDFGAHQHLKSGAKRVIVSAPCVKADVTIVLGVNEGACNLIEHKVISIGSCTTNCLAPIAKVLNDAFGIESGFMTTIHAYTNDQLLLDGSHKDKRRSRAAALSMIPSTTGAAKSIALVIPELGGRLDGAAIRVPVANVSMIDFKFVSRVETSAEAVNRCVAKAALLLPNILAVTEEELVSCDFNRSIYSAVLDTALTKVVNRNFCRVVAWYDNEWGFSNRMLEMTAMLSERLN